ncbi:MAG: HDIG domain-containing metalloprotein [Prevotella sp.]|jgi:putative nucleotidyltransferase with HDIG domain
MTKLAQLNSRFWRNIVIRLLVIAGCVTLIVWFLPRNEELRLRYEVGQPWMYNTLIAPFEFPVYKSDEAIRAEQDSILRDFQPYYNYEVDVEKRAIANFERDFPNPLPGLPDNARQIITKHLHHLYQTGIMQITDFNRSGQDTTQMIRVVTDKAATSTRVAKIYSTMSAYQSFFDIPELAAHRQALQQFNLTSYIQPNLIYDRERNATERDDMLSLIPPASETVKPGQKIVDRGQLIDVHTYRMLSSFEKDFQQKNATEQENKNMLIGQILYVTLLFVLFTLYLDLYRKDYFEDPRKIMMLYTLITVFPILVSIIMEHNFFSVYILPFAMAPMFVRVFLDSRTAFVAHVTMVLICVAALKYPYEFMVVQIIAGLVVILTMRELSRRAQIFQAAFLVTIANCFVFFVLHAMTYKDLDKTAFDFNMYSHFFVSGVLLLLAYPMMWLIEKTFGFVSNVTLFELSNTNKGLLRQLSEVAPGTFQHSITVSNLAEEIARRISRAKPLLVRTGALYHDIGKMTEPAYFTENQAGINPHTQLTNLESAQKIISHVTDGVAMAEKANLPREIREFISTHHGKGLVKYFYINEQNAHPDQIIDKAPYTYPGPNPYTLEQAILMMADGVEAASRSLQTYTSENITKLVNSIIDNDVREGFFNDCAITFQEIKEAKQVLIERLKNIYHTRIQYPTLSKEAKETALHEEALKKEAELKAEEDELKRKVSEEEKEIQNDNQSSTKQDVSKENEDKENQNKETEENKTEKE